MKEKLRKQAVLGTFVKIYSPALIEILGYCGIELIVIDTEHSNIDFAQVEDLVRAAKAFDMTVIVRVPYAREEYVLHALDSGANGVQIPGLCDIASAEQITKSTKYYPLGNRGLSFNQRSASYGFAQRNDYIKQSNENNLTVVHIENKEMVEEVEALCSNELIDVLFIGPMDLSQSYEVIGQTQSEPVKLAIEKTIAAAKKHNKIVGIFAGSNQEAKKYRDMGIHYIICSSDIGMFSSGAKNIVDSFNN